MAEVSTVLASLEDKEATFLEKVPVWNLEETTVLLFGVGIRFGTMTKERRDDWEILELTSNLHLNLSAYFGGNSFRFTKTT